MWQTTEVMAEVAFRTLY